MCRLGLHLLVDLVIETFSIFQIFIFCVCFYYYLKEEKRCKYKGHTENTNTTTTRIENTLLNRPDVGTFSRFPRSISSSFLCLDCYFCANTHVFNFALIYRAGSVNWYADPAFSSLTRCALKTNRKRGYDRVGHVHYIFNKSQGILFFINTVLTLVYLANSSLYYVVTLGIIWDTDSPSSTYITDVMDCITENLYMIDVSFFYVFITSLI